MQKPLSVTFRHMDPSPALEKTIRERALKLERFYDRIIHCTVSVDALHQSVRHGFPFEVHIEVVVPGKNIVAKTTSEMNHAHIDAYAAIRHTFDIAERRLEDYVSVKRHQVKRHTDDRFQTYDSDFDLGANGE